MKTLKILFGLLLLSITACTSGNEVEKQASDADAVLKQAFDEKEIVLINQIISYCDDYVLSKTDKNKSIKDAYQEFLTVNGPLAIEAGDGISFPLDVAFFETLDKDVLAKLFEVTDTLYRWIPERGIVKAEYSPYQLEVNLTHKYSDFLKILSTRNDFYSSYYKGFNVAGGISPSMYSKILDAFSKESEYKETFDFSRKEDRFAFIVPFIYRNS